MKKNHKTHYYCCAASICTPKETLESLKTEYNNIKKDMDTIMKMEISYEAKAVVVNELQEKIDDIKKRMHALIDKL